MTPGAATVVTGVMFLVVAICIAIAISESYGSSWVGRNSVRLGAAGWFAAGLGFLLILGGMWSFVEWSE